MTYLPTYHYACQYTIWRRKKQKKDEDNAEEKKRQKKRRSKAKRWKKLN